MKYNRIYQPLIVLFFLITGVQIMGEGQPNGLKSIIISLPETCGEWISEKEAVYYTPENLYEYINGGAELFISYGFLTMASYPYSKGEFQQIKVDICDMGNSKNAYGIFSHSRESIDHFVSESVESEYNGGLLTFWKGRYYVSILAYPETDTKRTIVKQLADRIAGAIQDPGQKPEILDLLPEKNLDRMSVSYFHHYKWLNSYIFLSDENMLNINEDVDAVIAKYSLDGTGVLSTVLLIIKYPDKEHAETASTRFKTHIIPESLHGFQKTDVNRWVGCSVDASILRIVLNAPDLESAEKLIKTDNEVKK